MTTACLTGVSVAGAASAGSAAGHIGHTVAGSIDDPGTVHLNLDQPGTNYLGTNHLGIDQSAPDRHAQAGSARRNGRRQGRPLCADVKKPGVMHCLFLVRTDKIGAHGA